MAILSSSISIVANDETEDNKRLTPGTDEVFVQLTRGFNCVVSQYRIAVCIPVDAQNVKIERDIGSGQYPAANDPNGPAPLFSLGAPGPLGGRILVTLSDGVSVPPGVAGDISVTIAIFQKKGGAFRRVDWQADQSNAVQLQSRFEITFQS